MSKRSREIVEQTRLLQSDGWNLQKSSRYNSGSESVSHAICKALVGHYVTHELGYRASFEVSHEHRGEIDVLVWATDGAPYAVECETGLTEETKQDKIERYVEGTVIRDVFFLEVQAMPENIMDAYAWVESELL